MLGCIAFQWWMPGPISFKVVSLRRSLSLRGLAPKLAGAVTDAVVSIAPRGSDSAHRPHTPLQRQGPRDVRGGRRPADGRVRSDLRVRRDNADAHTRQGAGADPDVTVLVRFDAGQLPQPRRFGGRPRGGRRPG